MTRPNPRDEQCGICGTLRVHEQNDGRDLTEVAVKLFGLEGETLVCVDCSAPFKAVLRSAGHPPWACMGWPTKEAAMADGWNPSDPDHDPFDD